MSDRAITDQATELRRRVRPLPWYRRMLRWLSRHRRIAA
jgi:hypothetical protein